MSGTRRKVWTKEELLFMEERKTNARESMRQDFVERFKTEITIHQVNRLCRRKGWKTGAAGLDRFYKAGASNGHQFRPLSECFGLTKKNGRGVGTERMQGGYVEVCIAETCPKSGRPFRWVMKHRHLWEAQHGKIPAGMFLKSKDDNPLNCDPSNWVMIARGVLLRLNGVSSKRNYGSAPAHLKPIILNTAILEHHVKNARK